MQAPVDGPRDQDQGVLDLHVPTAMTPIIIVFVAIAVLIIWIALGE